MRGTWGGLTLGALAAMALGAAPASATPALTSYVETRMGTDEGAADFGTGGGAGATFPGAVAPFGMLQVSPDTDPSLRNPAGGYTYSDQRIKGFSLTHISGAGCAGLGDVPLLPTTAAIDRSPAKLASYDVEPKYVAGFTHEGEVAGPGDYRVRLDPGPQEMRAELTANVRAGALRFTFPKGSNGSVLVNPGGSQMGNELAEVHVDPERREISGVVVSGAFCSAYNRYRLHFVARFDRPFTASGTWKRQDLRRGGRDVRDVSLTPQVAIVTNQYKRVAGLPDQLPGNPSTGAQAGGYATFDTREGEAVTARVAISSVSIDGARRNLDAGASEPFDALRAAARRAWERQLGKVRVGGGTDEQRRLLYTSLYHAMVMPSVFSDVDGRYRGMDGRIHQAEGFTKMANVSGWDTYRAQMPLMALLAPRQASDLVSSLLADHRESGHLPKWSLREGHTNVMVGDPADLLIAGAHAFGARDFDARAALRAMVDGATTYGIARNGRYVQRAGLADYLRLGYVGYERNTSTIVQTIAPETVWGTSATTLEYALADFGIARLAKALGDGETCATFARRSANWRNVLDPVSQIMRPRLAGTGAFLRGDPPGGELGFVEGSAAQYTWFVPHDVAGLVDALGGRDAARAKLDFFLSKRNDGVHSGHAFLGNEPTLHTPYLYDWLGAPARGAEAVRGAMLELYRPTAGGFPGNDDLGAMSSWWVFGALGMHPSVPGTGVLTLASPLFPRTQLRLAGGTVDIRAPKASAGTPYVVRATKGGKRLSRAWLSYDELAKGAKLRFDLSADPGQRWATGAGAAPPSYGGAAACTAP
ncbi:GH92 family glycosyl hydrolase [Conexibacter sp. SYSU D00693]|uniref:GH92 family glycosyl hydrolase n=1 Tax=Conexibacter sp. SYSU D00693 TaxID=2812560 RepID=UPI00196B2BEF|nr:GH92 family glycosyl hydrolase [Conexibacter sp. SYSU D00693]